MKKFWIGLTVFLLLLKLLVLYGQTHVAAINSYPPELKPSVDSWLHCYSVYYCPENRKYNVWFFAKANETPFGFRNQAAAEAWRTNQAIHMAKLQDSEIQPPPAPCGINLDQ